MTVRCHHCATVLDPDSQLTFRRVVGWERKALDPSRRGGSDIVLREHLNEFACPICIERLKSGLNVSQEALL